MNWAKFSIKNALFLNLLTAVVIIFGVVSGIRMKREAFPAVDFDVVNITTVYPGASSREVEEYVTNLIEDELQSLDGIEEVRSKSSEGLSLLVIKIAPDLSAREKNTVVNDIQIAVDRIRDFPAEVLDDPLVTEVKSGTMPVMEMSLSGDLSYEKLHAMADRLIDEIKKLPSASQPSAIGFWDKEFWVEVDPKKLDENHIGLTEIVGILQARNYNLPGGVIKSKEGEFLVRTLGEVETPEEIDSIVLRANADGTILRIKDVGKTRLAFEEGDRVYRTDGKPSINLIVKKKASGDILELVREVKEVSASFLERPENAGLKIAFFNDISRFVRNRLGVLFNNGIAGIVLVLLSLLLFLSRGIALVAALGMPIAFVGAILVMNMLGMTINLLTMFALVIVLGMLVDDAIIVAENIWRHHEQGKGPLAAAIAGTKEVFWPVTTTILTTIAAFSPLLMVSGIFGKFIETLPKVVIVSLVISLIEAMIILPSHAFDVMRLGEWRRKGKSKNPEGKPQPADTMMHKMTRVYEKVLKQGLRFRYLLFLSLILTFVGSIALVRSQMKVILFPSDGVEVFFLRGNLPLGSPVEETSEKFQFLERVIRDQLPKEELQHYVTMIGIQQRDPMDPFTVRAGHVGQIGLYMSPENARDRSVKEIIESIRPVVLEEGKKYGISNISFVAQRIGPPVGKPVAVRLQSDNMDQLVRLSEKVQGHLKEQNAVSDVDDDYMVGKRELNVMIDDKAASQALISTGDIALHVRASLEGRIASHVNTNGERIPIRVRLLGEERNKVSTLKSAMITNKAGYRVPLTSVTKMSEGQGVTEIRHLEGKRTITVTADLDEKKTSSEAVNRSIQPFLDQLALQNPGVTITTGGEYEDTTNSVESMINAFSVAVALIFLILATQFKSLTQPIVIMAAIPFGLIGVVWAFYVHGLPLSFLGMIGMIGLTGVVVNDSIVLVDFINKARDRGMEALDAAIYAGARRFRPVLLTSITTILGLLPLAYGLGGYDKFLRPAAMALGYGLLFATVLILLLVPALYLIRIDVFNVLILLFRRPLKAFGIDLERIK